MLQQLDLLAGVPALPPLEVGHACAKACLEAAEQLDQFDSKGAQQFIFGHVVRNGPTSGEDLVEAAKAHGFKGKDDRCFGGVFIALLNAKKLMVLRSDLPRKRGHGTSGGRLYGVVR